MSPVSTWHCFLSPNVCSGHGRVGGGGGERDGGRDTSFCVLLSQHLDYLFFFFPSADISADRFKVTPL